MKAILVIDKPESCTGCLLGIYNKEWFCLKTNKNIYITDRYHIPEWCPLKPMPTYDWHEEGKENECEEWYRNGWNDCLEEIEKDVRKAEHD